jgi:hypothetical protein
MTDVSTAAQAAFDGLKAGVVDPHFDVKIHTIILKTPDRIVYLDDKYDIWWRKADSICRHLPVAEAQVADLESWPMYFLSRANRFAFRSLVANAFAVIYEQDQVGDDPLPPTAKTLFDNARAFYKARTTEKARFWYLLSGIVLCVLAVALACAEVLCPMCSWRVNDPYLHRVILGCLGGGLGASLWMMIRIDTFPSSPESGMPLHVAESIARFLIGVVTGLVIVLAIRSSAASMLNLGTGTNPVPTPSNADNSWLVLLTIVAGATERFLPNLVSKIGRNDAAASAAPAAAANPAPAPGPATPPAPPKPPTP